MLKSTADDRHDRWAFLRYALKGGRLGEEFLVIANKELADAYCRQNRLPFNYRRFPEIVAATGVQKLFRLQAPGVKPFRN